MEKLPLSCVSDQRMDQQVALTNQNDKTCTIEAPATPPIGASITLQMALSYKTLSYKTDAVKIDAAIVGWTIKDQYFGVKFLDVKPPERVALDQYIASLSELAPLSLF